jgi:transcriptional regulator with XRE-family HTH domain
MGCMIDRRAELAAFLRTRRERITPDDVGLPPGLRRRTPGLRREEVAQLAGVGVTWYTWLEQGRPINASTQVLDAISRTLRLDQAERHHLYRLADVPAVPSPAGDDVLPTEIQAILDRLAPLPGCVLNARYDLLAWNEPYQALFPKLVAAEPDERNTLWQCFVCHRDDPPFLNRETELRLMVATLRAGYGRHLAEPAWTRLIDRLTAASAEFAQMWAVHEVAEPGPRIKLFVHREQGVIRLSATSMQLSIPPETRMFVYTPVDDEARSQLDRAVG